MSTRRVKHQWIKSRAASGMADPHLVLRIDNYNDFTRSRGQFYPKELSPADKDKAIWPDYKTAEAAAAWAVDKFGHTYGIFKMVSIAEPTVRPTKITKV